MADRYTRKDADAALARLAAMLGRSVRAPYVRGASYEENMAANVGTLELDHNATYGGYVITEVTASEHGRRDEDGTYRRVTGYGKGHPFGDRRRSARELWELVNWTRDALEARGNHSGSVRPCDCDHCRTLATLAS